MSLYIDYEEGAVQLLFLIHSTRREFSIRYSLKVIFHTRINNRQELLEIIFAVDKSTLSERNIYFLFLSSTIILIIVNFLPFLKTSELVDKSNSLKAGRSYHQSTHKSLYLP